MIVDITEKKHNVDINFTLDNNTINNNVPY